MGTIGRGQLLGDVSGGVVDLIEAASLDRHRGRCQAHPLGAWVR